MRAGEVLIIRFHLKDKNPHAVEEIILVEDIFAKKITSSTDYHLCSPPALFAGEPESGPGRSCSRSPGFKIGSSTHDKMQQNQNSRKNSGI